MQRSALAVLLSLIVSGCASLHKKTNADGSLVDEADIHISGKEVPSQKVMDNIAKPYVSPLGEIPLDRTPLTEQWIRYFQGRGRRYMEVYLKRSSRYLPMMKNTLRENGLPEDLVYIALIESGFSPMAHSHANAVGYWQFIRSTGKRFGLMVDPFIDERRDPVLSTRAAAEYFKALYGLFGSWHLSMASYNVGENRVARSVAKYRTRDFWRLIKNRRAFPKETKHYVPKFIAAALIAKDPAKYGFTNIPYEPPLAFDTVQLVNPISMTRMAEAAGVDLKELKLLNPKFRGDYVPQYRGNETLIRVPVGKMAAAVAAIPQSFSPAPKVIAADHYFYRVKRGDSLSTIARRHRTSVSKLKRLNNMGNRTFLRVGQKLKVPDRGGSLVTYEMPVYPAAQPVVLASVATPTAPVVTEDRDERDENAEPAPSAIVAQDSPQAADPEVTSDEEGPEKTAAVHIVRRGENLTLISKKYGISIAELRRLNRLNRRAVLRAGQTLRLKSEESEEASKSSAQDSRRFKKASKVKAMVASVKKSVAKSKTTKSKTTKSKTTKIAKHRVRPGETLAGIAGRYKVSIGELVRRNRIKNRSHVLAGSDLVIPK